MQTDDVLTPEADEFLTDLQREFAGRAASVVELDAGHHPFLSQPAEVRDLIVGL